jgi:hypothetical protein
MSDETQSNRWYIFDLYTPHGGKITVKESDPTQIASNIQNLIADLEDVLKTHKGWSLVPPPLPSAPQSAPATAIQMRGGDGLPVVDGDLQPVMVPLPPDHTLQQVIGLSHSKNKDRTKDLLKVFTPEYERYGVNAFGNGPDGWHEWPLDAHYAPPEGFRQVIIKKAEGDKYANVVEFR